MRANGLLHSPTALPQMKRPQFLMNESLLGLQRESGLFGLFQSNQKMELQTEFKEKNIGLCE